MLSRVLQDHYAATTAQRAERDRLRTTATDAVTEAADLLAETLNIRVAKAFQNQKDIETEAKRLQAATSRYIKMSKQWLELVGKLNGALKELGDAENWGKAIDKDIKDISTVLTLRNNSTR